MNLSRIVWWPRLLAIAYALFISIFAADAFEGMVGFWQKATSLFMHLIPTWLCIGVIAIAWKREWIGAVLFVALAGLHLVTMWSRGFHWSGYAAIEVPLVVLGVLYLLAWRARRRDAGAA